MTLTERSQSATMPGMNVLFVTNLYPPHVIGGFEIRCGQTAVALAAKGHRVTILTSCHGVSAPMEEAGPATVHRKLELYLPFADAAGTIPFRLNRQQRWSITRHNYRLSREFARTLDPNVVMFWSQARLTLGPARAIQDLGIPSTWTFGDPNITQYRPVRLSRRHFIDYLLDRFVLRATTWAGIRFHYAHVLSKDLHRRLLEAGLPLVDPRVIYRGIPVDRFPLRENPGGLHTPVRLLFVGQLHPFKGVHTLIQALRLLSVKHGPHYATLTVAGDGDVAYVERLRTLASACEAKTTFLGRVTHSDLPGVYRDHDVFVFPSSGGGYEGFGVTHLEAMASGLPVIGTVSGGQAELFEDGNNAVVFEAENPADLARAIENLVTHHVLRARIVSTARRQVDEHHSMEAFTDSFERLLKDAVDGR